MESYLGVYQGYASLPWYELYVIQINTILVFVCYTNKYHTCVCMILIIFLKRHFDCGCGRCKLNVYCIALYCIIL